MANAWYEIYRRNVQTPQAGFAAVDLAADTIKVLFIDEADDTIDLVNDQDIADRASLARVPALASAPSLAGKSVSGAGVFDASDTVFSNLSGDQVESFDYLKDTGTEASSILLANYDTATGLPLTPNGADVTIQHHASGIWQVG
jgi:hypothetical protein